ncbi:MAG: hypothetical protein KC593_21350 [Myxococcales bacterium]|nr:hypothetical protein [Myxococcales bacterium]
MNMARFARYSLLLGALGAVALGAAWLHQPTSSEAPTRATETPGVTGPRVPTARQLALQASAREADERYAAEVVDDGVVARNPEQAFGVRIASGRAQVVAHEAGFELALALVSAGREGATLGTEPGAVTAESNRIEVPRGDVLEWYLNGPLGLEQGFELRERPAGEGPLRFELSVEGLHAEPHPTYVALLDDAGAARAHYSDLYALDALGDELPARMLVQAGRIVLEVDDAHAQYPIVVDPLLSTQEARLSPAIPRTGRYGASVAASTTSVQGDWAVVGAPNDDRAGLDAGVAYVYRRNAANTGWDFVATLTASDASPGAHFGASVAVGATSGTQVRVLVGAPDVSAGGRVYAYTYTSATLALAATQTYTAPAPAAGDRFGAALAVNYTVGLTAFAVGSPGANAEAGVVHTYRNSAFEATLSASDAAAGDHFGAAMLPVYSDADGLVIGAPDDDASAAVQNSGSVYRFLRNVGPPVTWNEQAKFSHASPLANARLGASMVRIGNGQYLVGEPGRVNGAAHRITVQAGGLVSSATITAADGAAGDGFGTCVSFSEAGTTDHVIIGAPGVDTAALLGGQGALYRYTLSAAFATTFVERFTGAVTGDAAGGACAMPGVAASTTAQVALFGIPGDDTHGLDAGRVRSQNVATNTTETYLTPDSVNTDRFGRMVVIDGDTAAVGATHDDGISPNAGAVTIFVRSGTTWSTQARIEVPGHQLMGGALALDGDVLAIGSLNGGANTVYVARRTGTTWSSLTALAPVGVVAGDAFGVSLSLDAGTLAVGAYGADGAGNGRGAVYVFVDQAGTFAQQAVLSASNGSDLDGFGYAVAVEGDTLVVGAPGRDGGGGAQDIGIGYVFARSGVTWTQQGILAGPPTAGSAFGKAVAIFGARVAVGAPAVPVGGTAMGAGSFRTFTRNGVAWNTESVVTLAGAVMGDEFGATLALSNDTLMVGAPGRENAGRTDVGVVVPYHRQAGAWTPNAVLAAPGVDDSDADDFGRAVAAHGHTVIVGAPLSDVDASDAGAAYVFSVLRGLGEACDTSDQCSSTVCVDGVCCGSSCGGGNANDCMACSVAAGGTTDGTCTGLSAAAAPTVVCRAATPGNACDVAETCAVGNMACPANASAPDGTSCGGAPSGVCDAQNQCMAGSCVARYASSGTVCRSSVGPCDAAETCTGSSASCPADNLSALNGTPCGGAPSGLCDAQDLCMANTCVARWVAMGTPCRPASGECDVAETCTGSSASCPPDDVNAKNGVGCGGDPSGPCDAQDTCMAGSCVSRYAPATTLCRASTNSCDVEELCTGSSTQCPSDVNSCCMSDADCNDGNVCTVDTCNLTRGYCEAGPPMAGCCSSASDCNDGNSCTADSCDTVNHVCVFGAPAAGCCSSASDCDDSDPCTLDACVASACSHDANPACNMMDAGVPTDAGTSTDAGVPTDAGTSTDAGVPTDAGLGGGDDAGVTTDGGGDDAGNDDAGANPDGGMNPDGGAAGDMGVTPRPDGGGGCSCVVVGDGAPGAHPMLPLGVLALLALGHRVRRRKR